MGLEQMAAASADARSKERAIWVAGSPGAADSSAGRGSSPMRGRGGGGGAAPIGALLLTRFVTSTSPGGTGRRANWQPGIEGMGGGRRSSEQSNMRHSVIGFSPEEQKLLETAAAYLQLAFQRSAEYVGTCLIAERCLWKTDAALAFQPFAGTRPSSNCCTARRA